MSDQPHNPFGRDDALGHPPHNPSEENEGGLAIGWHPHPKKAGEYLYWDGKTWSTKGVPTTSVPKMDPRLTMVLVVSFVVFPIVFLLLAGLLALSSDRESSSPTTANVPTVSESSTDRSEVSAQDLIGTAVKDISTLPNGDYFIKANEYWFDSEGFSCLAGGENLSHMKDGPSLADVNTYYYAQAEGAVSCSPVGLGTETLDSMDSPGVPLDVSVAVRDGTVTFTRIQGG